MIQRLRKITKDLYRGSAPTAQDVQQLKDKLGINKIVSLDRESGDKISRTCKLLGIDQIKLYIDHDRKSLINAVSKNLKKLLTDGGPTYLHCYHGKDRTGLISALFKCKYMNTDPEEAIEEAKSLGFGEGINPSVTELYEKLIRNCKPEKDDNSADIVSNEREYVSDNRDSFLDEGHQGSFSPYLSVTRQNPMDALYNFIMDQPQTRENYPGIKKHDSQEEDVVPMVGVFDNDAGGRGFGPTENAGGFIYD